MPTRPHLPALSGFRALAALHVFAFHFLPWTWRAQSPLATGFVHAGYVSVSALFLLSGFVLAVNYPDPLDAEGRTRFLLARIARIYPSYLAALLLYAPVAVDEWFGGAPPIPLPPAMGFALTALLAATLSQAWLPWTARLWNAPGWATSTIFFGYALFPALTGALGRVRGRRLLAIAAGAWLGGLVPAALYVALAPDGTGASTGTQGALIDLLKHHPVARVGEFFTGAALGLWWVRGGRRLRVPGWATGGAAVAALTLATLSPPLLPYAFVHNGLLSPLLAVLLVGLASGEGALARALSARPLVTLGGAGFAFYVLQWPVWFVAERIARPLGVDTLSGAWFVAVGASLCLFTVAWTRWVERPLRRAIRGALERRPRALPSGAAEA
jgi:peptidoglycan/LPS O-acetylase OafA/YrhL